MSIQQTVSQEEAVSQARQWASEVHQEFVDAGFQLSEPPESEMLHFHDGLKKVIYAPPVAATWKTDFLRVQVMAKQRIRDGWVSCAAITDLIPMPGVGRGTVQYLYMASKHLCQAATARNNQLAAYAMERSQHNLIAQTFHPPQELLIAMDREHPDRYWVQLTPVSLERSGVQRLIELIEELSQEGHPST